MPEQYCAVKWMRGTGLGNKLFPWARCIIFSCHNKIPMLMPQWFHIRKAPFIKGGINYKHSFRKILLYKNFYNPGEYISGLNKIKILFHYSDKQSLVTKSYHIPSDKKLFIFQGDGDFFDDFRDSYSMVKENIWKIVHPDLKVYLDKIVVPSIVMNIRRGKDFSEATTNSDFYTKGAIRTPLSWFYNTLLRIREVKGFDVPAMIVSDGTKEDLLEILSLPNTTLAQSPSAITDLLILSQAKVILGSGGSSFSAWGSFLSRAVTVSIPGQSLQWFKVSHDLNDHFVGTFDPFAPDEQVLKLINEKL